MRLETLCSDAESEGEAVAVPLTRDPSGIWRSDWSALLPTLLDTGVDPAARANAFHSSLARALFEQAVVVRRQSGVTRVALSGGVFQNRILTERAAALLTAAGFEVLIPQRLPVNDAAISFGQLIETLAIDGSAA